MDSEPSTTLTAILGFLSEIKWGVFLLFFAFIFKEPITGLLNRLRNFTWRKGDSELVVNTTHSDPETTVVQQVRHVADKEEPEEPEESDSGSTDLPQQPWFVRMMELMDDGDLSAAVNGNLKLTPFLLKSAR